MQVNYKNHQIEKICTNASVAAKRFDKRTVGLIQQRVDEIHAADSVEMLVQFAGQQHPRVDAAPAFVQESSAPFCKSIVHIVPSLVLTLLVSFITKRIVRAEGNVKAAKTDFQI